MRGAAGPFLLNGRTAVLLLVLGFWTVSPGFSTYTGTSRLRMREVGGDMSMAHRHPAAAKLLTERRTVI